jgi:hypothetical protein
MTRIIPVIARLDLWLTRALDAAVASVVLITCAIAKISIAKIIPRCCWP